MLRYVDLFAGCGGLSLGLEKAGFDLHLAVEKSPMAAETFYHNFIQLIDDPQQWNNYLTKSVDEQYESKLIVNELISVLRNQAIMDDLSEADLDLVVGGPPCQGFSLAGRRDPLDERNQLPWQFLDFVNHVKPKAVVMENVLGMNRDFKKHDTQSPFQLLKDELAKVGGGYQVQAVELNAMHYGVPQHRPRVMLLALHQDLEIDVASYFIDDVWKSAYEGNTLFARPSIVPSITHQDGHFRTVRDAFWDIGDNGYLTDEVADYTEIMRDSRQWHLNDKPSNAQLLNHNLRNHTQRVENRFRLYQYLKASDVSSNAVNIPAKKNLSQVEKIATLKELYADVVFPAISTDEEILAHTLDELIDLTFELKTRKHSQRPLDLMRPSPTMLSIPDDFVHPRSPRTLTVREMARLQSFPDMFEFRAKETTGSKRRKIEVPQYTQVGNAVPPLLAYALGQNFYNILNEIVTSIEYA